MNSLTHARMRRASGRVTLCVLALGAFALLLATSARAVDPEQDEPTPEQADSEDSHEQGTEPLRVYDEVEVRSRSSDLVGVATSANEGATGRADLERRPILRAGEIVESTPGVVATQHSGGGKANQYFLRGFNLDHGTDFSLSVGGVPVNMPTHGHGQGYADLAFLIPETIDHLYYRKGPYWADQGDFSAAGSAQIDLSRRVGDRVEFAGGSYGEGRVLWLDGIAADPTSNSLLRRGDAVVAVELFRSDGPWTRDDEYEGVKTLLRWETGDATRGSSVAIMGYDADWLSTDQVPRRAVDSGLIERFDLIDSGPRGSTSRWSLSAKGHRGTDDALLSWSGYALYYDFRLVSNFTYLLEDPLNGDQFEQLDERWIFGGEFRGTWQRQLFGRSGEVSAGVDIRHDDIDNGLFRTSDLRQTGTVRSDAVRQVTGGPWAEFAVDWTDRVRVRAGLRAELFDAEVDSDLAINSGSRSDVLLSPNLNFTFGPWNDTEVYLNLGWGHHSNDARGAVIRVDPSNGESVERVDPLVRARGADLGFRTSAWRGAQSTLTVFGLELDSELLFVGDGGATEASRPSRRVGVEWTHVQRIGSRLQLDLDITWTDAEFTDGERVDGELVGNRIPGAVETTIAGGVSWAAPEGPGFFGGLRWRYFDGAPLVEDGSVTASTTSLVNGRLGHRFESGLDLVLEVFNLLDEEASDIEYFYASRLPGEPLDGVEDVHFHPVQPLSARLVLMWRY
ncbi:MAG: TonB-dependent receptor plug domain-containing protein [Thermoanaerobaculia bacterium]|nr:TonB-dependent receptor plug domain-containing protein [Thermoanaerobaculia bacterium]